MPFTQPFAEDDLRLFFAVEGQGAHAVVFLHGLAGHAGEWSASAEAIGDSYRTVRMDQRCHGNSSLHAADMSRHVFADDVAAVIHAAGVPTPVTLVGQSMGAHTALVTADRHPDLVSHLIMVEGDVGGGGLESLDMLDAAITAWPKSFASYEEVRDFFGGDTATGRAWAASYGESDGRWWPRFDPAVVRELMTPVFAVERWDLWERLTIPIDLVIAERSAIDGARVERMRRIRTDTRFHTVADTGHDLHLDQPEHWIALLKSLLDR
jgi:pimeloyl-ACP methyl ester carboxylesterase